MHQTFGPEASADLDDRPRPIAAGAEPIDEADLVDDYEWDAFAPDPEEGGSEEEALLDAEEDELDLDDSEFDWEAALDEDAELDQANVARVEAAFDRMHMSVARTYADEEPLIAAVPGTLAEDAREDLSTVETEPELALEPEDLVLDFYEAVAAEPEAETDDESELIVVSDAEAWSTSAPHAEAEVEVETEATALHQHDSALQQHDSVNDEADAAKADGVVAAASIDVDDWDEVENWDELDDWDELQEVDDRSAADTRAETSVEDDVIAAFSDWVAGNEDAVDEEDELPQRELVDFDRPYDVEREEDDRAALGASVGAALVHGPEQADEESDSTYEWGDEQSSGEWQRTLDDSEDVQWGASPSVEEPLLHDEPLVATNGQVHGAESDDLLIAESAPFAEQIHPEFEGEEDTGGATLVPGPTTGTAPRRSPVFRVAIVVGCVFLAVIAGAGIVRALHQSAPGSAGTTATTSAPAASATVAEARLRAATDTADSATTTAQAELAALPGIPTPAKVGAVVNQYIASLQLYETFLTGASVPVAAQPAATAVGSEVQSDLASFTTINGIAPANLGAYLNRFTDDVGHLQSSLSTLEQALRGP